MEEALKGSVSIHLQTYHRGRKQSIKARALAEYFKVGHREINSIIRELRRSGLLVGSTKIPPYGYYIPAGELEIKEYLDCFRDELFDMLTTFNRQRRAQRSALHTNRQRTLFWDQPSVAE